MGWGTSICQVNEPEPFSSAEPDLLAGATLNSLTRPLYYPLAWGALPTFIAAILAGGVLPAVMIPKWLKGVVAQHQQQLWHLAEWMRLQGNHADLAELQDITRSIRFNVTLALLAPILAISAGAVGLWHWNENAMQVQSLYTLVFTFPQSPAAVIFTILLILAAGLNWLHLALHQRNVNRYLQQFNRVAARLELEPIEIPRLQTGLRPLWLLAGIALSSAGAIWPIPSMLAGAAHRRYTLVCSVKLRAMLAQRMRTILNHRQPPLKMPKPLPTVIRACIRPSCRAGLPVDAAFCPRCGTPAANAVDVVA